jgi:hypothetical protein
MVSIVKCRAQDRMGEAVTNQLNYDDGNRKSLYMRALNLSQLKFVWPKPCALASL